MRENISEIMESKKQFDDISWIRKKIETLNSTIHSMKNTDSDANPKERYTFDMAKYVDNYTFQEFIKNFNMELFNANKRIDEVKRMVDDLIISLKNKVSDRDLKNLESKKILLNILVYLVKKLDDAVLFNSKKYADKHEINKSIKFLDSQVRIFSNCFR